MFFVLGIIGITTISYPLYAVDSIEDQEATERSQVSEACYENYNDAEQGFENFKNILTKIPIVGGLIGSISEYLEFVVKVFLDLISSLGSNVVDILSMLADFITLDNFANIEWQKVFGSNQYCGQHDIYKEESSILQLKYAMFPIYPLNIGLNASGICEINDNFLENRFLQLVTNPISGSLVEGSTKTYKPKNSKCSYSYTNYNATCVLHLDLPILLEAEIAELVVSAVCMFTDIKNSEKAAGEAKSKIASMKNLLKLGKMIGTTMLDILGDAAFNFDPYSLKQYYGMRIVFLLVKNLISSIPNVAKMAPCLITSSVAIATHEVVMPSIMDGVIASKFNTAKEGIKTLRFCGNNWYNYTKTEDGKYYERGSGEKSYSACVSACAIADNESSSKCYDCLNALWFNTGSCSNKSCTDKIDGVINKSIKEGLDADNTSVSLDTHKPYENDVWNKIFREYIYDGEEYSSNFDKSYACYDPRLPEQKGYYGVIQRYYMRGNDKANFACDRFSYSGRGCVLHESQVNPEDRTNPKVIRYNVKDGIDDKHSKVFYAIYDENLSDGVYKELCYKAFHNARKCCVQRTQDFVCLENINTREAKFCKANKVPDEEERFQSLAGLLFSMLKTDDDDEVNDEDYQEVDEGICTLHVSESNTKVKMQVVKRRGNNYACVISDNLCPYNFKLAAGLNYKATYCDDNSLLVGDDEVNGVETDDLYRRAEPKLSDTELTEGICQTGLFSVANCESIKTGEIASAYGVETNNQKANLLAWAFDKTQADMKDYNGADWSNIFARSSDGYGQPVATSAFGRVKNFCQYKAHCVKVEPETVLDMDYMTTPAFMDASCNTNNNSNSRHIYGAGFSRQLTSRVVECVYESLKNLVNGVAGYSSCQGSFTLNADGFCGNDNADTIERKLQENDIDYIRMRYQSIGNRYFIKGYELPEELNPFIKLQTRMKHLIRIAIALSLVFWGFKMTVLGGFNEVGAFSDRKFLSKIMVNLIKFAIVCYFALGTGWRDGASDYLLNFATSIYSYTNRLVGLTLKGTNVNILNSDKTFGITAGSTNTPISFCYRWDLFNNLKLEAPNKDNSCSRRFKSTKLIELGTNQEISSFSYFISKLNKEDRSGRYKLALYENNTYKSDSVSLGNIWNKKYDGCYFDINEYEDDKKYLSIFDTIDCKIIRYLGFAPKLNVANIFIIPLLFVFINSLGTFLLGLVLTFVFALFNVLIEACYIFLVSFFSISILIFVSPIILPLALFEKTKNIFDKWLSKLISFVFQPVLMLVTLVLYINIVDIFALKNMAFIKHNSEGRFPTVVCGNNVSSYDFFCVINDPTKIFKVAANAAVDIFKFIRNMITQDTAGDLSQYPIFSMICDMLILFILFKLGDQLLAAAKLLGDKLFGSGVDTAKSQGLAQGMDNTNQLGKLTNKNSLLNRSLRTGRRYVASNAIPDTLDKGADLLGTWASRRQESAFWKEQSLARAQKRQDALQARKDSGKAVSPKSLKQAEKRVDRRQKGLDKISTKLARLERVRGGLQRLGKKSTFVLGTRASIHGLAEDVGSFVRKGVDVTKQFLEEKKVQRAEYRKTSAEQRAQTKAAEALTKSKNRLDRKMAALQKQIDSSSSIRKQANTERESLLKELVDIKESATRSNRSVAERKTHIESSQARLKEVREAQRRLDLIRRQAAQPGNDFGVNMEELTLSATIDEGESSRLEGEIKRESQEIKREDRQITRLYFTQAFLERKLRIRETRIVHGEKRIERAQKKITKLCAKRAKLG